MRAVYMTLNHRNKRNNFTVWNVFPFWDLEYYYPLSILLGQSSEIRTLSAMKL